MTDKLIRRRAFGDAQVKALPRKAKRYIKPDPDMRGLYLRVPTTGPVVFAVVSRDCYGKQVWTTIGNADTYKIDEARDSARSIIKRVKAGQPAIEPPKPKPDSVEVVAHNWLARVVEKHRYVAAPEMRRIVDKYILAHPPFKGRSFVSIKKSELATFLDHVEDAHGAPQADQVLSVFRSIANWTATRDDSYMPPFTKGMKRRKITKRDRVLDDAEIRKVWQAADDAGSFGRLVKFLLLTGQRRGAVLAMCWSDIDADGTWTIREGHRAKGTGGILKLPKVALDIIRQQPRFASNDLVFAHCQSNLDRFKKRLDEMSGVDGYVLHDLRRTARSLLSRANVRPDISERVLGHARKGIEGVYDHYPFTDEKAKALADLAKLIRTILAGPQDSKNIVRLREAAAVS
jgi:integrase